MSQEQLAKLDLKKDPWQYSYLTKVRGFFALTVLHYLITLLITGEYC